MKVTKVIPAPYAEIWCDTYKDEYRVYKNGLVMVWDCGSEFEHPEWKELPKSHPSYERIYQAGMEVL